MRPSKSRHRSKGNRNRSVGNIVNRVFESLGPEGKVRGTPQQIIDKYNQLARDAQLSNDRVATENFQQHSEHYTRMLGEALREQEERRQRGDPHNQAPGPEDQTDGQRGDARQAGDRRDANPGQRRDGGQTYRRDGNAAHDRRNDGAVEGRDGAPARDRRGENVRDWPETKRDGAGDVIDIDAGGYNDLVETPESKPRRGRPRKLDDAEEAAAGVEAPEAKPKRGRPRKTPATDAETDA